MWWVVSFVAFVAAVAAYSTWVAARVDRLHRRVDAAFAALDAQLARRAAAAVTLAEVDRSLGEHAAALRLVATGALRPASEGREYSENQLTRTLRELGLPTRIPRQRAAPESGVEDGQVVEAMAELVGASRRVALARQVYTDLVRETLAARRRPLARMLRLGRGHRRPAYFDIEDPVLDG